MEKSTDINELSAALALAQGELADPKAAAGNPFFNSKYATLAMVLAAVRPVFSKHGLAVTQMVGDIEISGDSGRVMVTTMLTHSSGQWIASSAYFPISGKRDAQAVGSALTYCRRYMLAAITGVAQDDDDGNSAVDADKLKGKGGTTPPPSDPPPNPNKGKGEQNVTPASTVCSVCGGKLSVSAADYSRRVFGRYLCIPCQKIVNKG